MAWRELTFMGGIVGMNMLQPVFLFKAAFLLYGVGLLCALILYKWPKQCNIAANSIYIAASGFLLAGAAIYLGTGAPAMDIAIWHTAFDFITFGLQLDALSAVFLIALAALVLSVSIYSIGYVSHYYGKRNVALFQFLYATFVLSMILVFTASNVVCFYVAWEAMAVISYFLVVFEAEQRENQKAGMIYLIMTHIGTAFLLIAFAMMYSYTGSLDLFGSSEAIPVLAKNIIFVLLLIGFFTKAGAIPLHIWLPYAHPAAPGNISALMSGIMIKTAVYGLLRFVLGYLGVQSTWWGMLILCIGIASAVLSVAYALMEQNIKRLLAYSSVENMGIILIGLGVAFSAFSQNHAFVGGLALLAALFHSFNHTLFKGGLFLGAGAIQYATHSKNMEQLGGLIKKMPLTALLVLCFSLAISALIPFNGFVSEWLTYQALFADILTGSAGGNILAILAVAALGLAGALAAACFVKLFGITFLGLPRSNHAVDVHKVPVSMNAGMGVLALACLLVGLFPVFVLKMMNQAVVAVAGVSVAEQLQGGIAIAYYQLNMGTGTIAPSVFLIALAGLILFSFVLLRIIGGKYVERKYGTWDCGFEALNARMQYTATGFAKPIKIVFRILFRPSRKTIMEGAAPYHPITIKYVTKTESVFENYIYRPICDLVKGFSKRVSVRVQTGHIHTYLLYIFITLLVLISYNMFA